MLSSLRCAKVPVAVAFAAAWIGATAAPAFADQIRAQQWWLKELHVTNAWATSKGSGVTVALLDTGVYKTADLHGQVTTGPDFTRSGRHSRGRFWGIHGTAMASLIAGHGHGPGDRSGISGTAPKAKVLSIRTVMEVNDPLQGSRAVASRQLDAIASGIRYAADHGAQVVDLPADPSAAGLNEPAAKVPSGGSKAERAAVAYAQSKGVVLVAPAGDDGNGADRVNYPAAYPGVISVGAFNNNIIKAPYSNRRSYVTLTAAGDGVIAAEPAGTYATIHSTSAASAVVAGMAALIKSRYPAFSPAQVMAALTRGTVFHRSGGRPDGSGFGTADAARALAAAAGVQQEWPPPTGTGNDAGGAAVPAAPGGQGVRAIVRHNGLRIFLGLLVALLALSLIAVARMPAPPPRLPSQEPDQNTGELPQIASPYAPWPPAVLRGGPPGELPAGQRRYAEGPSRMLPARPVSARRPAGASPARTGDAHGPVLDPIPWQGTIRPPNVPGGPPWAPAPKPEGEPPPPRPPRK
jgi:Subtilase family